MGWLWFHYRVLYVGGYISRADLLHLTHLNYVYKVIRIKYKGYKWQIIFIIY